MKILIDVVNPKIRLVIGSYQTEQKNFAEANYIFWSTKNFAADVEIIKC